MGDFMKLNNHGWGTMEMFLLCGGLFIALLVAIFFISKFYDGLEIETMGRQYMNMEAKLELAGREFVKENALDVDLELKINYDTLYNNGNIKKLEDNAGNECKGYVIITKNNSKLHYDYKGYVSCPNDTTKHYE